MYYPIEWSGPWRCRVWLDDRALWLFCALDMARRALKAGQRVIIWVVVLVTVLAAVAMGMDLLTALGLVAGTGYAAQEIARWAVGSGRTQPGGGMPGPTPLPVG